MAKKPAKDRLTELRKERAQLEMILSALRHEGKEEQAYAVRRKISEINASIADLIWSGAKMEKLEIQTLNPKLEHALAELYAAGLDVSVGLLDTLNVSFPKGTRSCHTLVSLCDDPRFGFYTIEGRVQNITDWIEAVKC